VFAVLWLARPAWANGGELLVIPEVIIPDLRLELERRDLMWTLSLPVHVLLYHEHLFTSEKSHYSAFVEPQWRPSGNEWRGALGIRLVQPVVKPVALLAEGAGLAATDGHGGFAGAGIGFFDRRTLGGMGYLTLVYRHVMTTEGHREDFSLDLLYVFWR
jgi:hypothetical protein